MDEYISREETVKAFCEKCKGYYDGHCIHRGECDIDVIKTAPAADVQPVKHGRWITKSDVFYIAWQESGRRWEDMPYFATGLNFACSNCFEKFDVNAEGVEKWNGCPLCLARMDGDAE